METILVHWFIKAGQENEFMNFRKPTAVDTLGFQGEVLYQRIDQPEPGVVQFLNVGRWDSREMFEQKHLRTPTNEEFEQRPRKREWLKHI